MNRAFIPPTERRGMTKARAAKVFLRRNGICWGCNHQIRDGEKWTVEHPDQLALGGSDDDADLWPIHLTKCRKEKDARDAAERAKRNRIVTAGFAGKPISKLSKAYRREVLRRINEAKSNV